ncbi:hypothetical protein [Methylopila sp. M107]|uniref:hypothetical protein n=1 Tax=Methylopila sp. M107 TaxID=1101190 RepID=UPI0003664CE0|nr:hypothetical protein [Methylopila sp. M107]
MGLVLAFDTAPRPAARPPLKRVQSAKSADILFFTGVRYERDRPRDAAQSGPIVNHSEPTQGS